MTLRRLLASSAVALLAAASLSGCVATVSLQPAHDANNPLCARVMVSLPNQVAGESRRWTDAQSTASWGSPAAVILSCGVTPPGPTTEECITLGGVDWVVDQTEAPRYRVTTFGRKPAVQVYLDNDVVGSNDVLQTLAPAVVNLPVSAACSSSVTVPK